jgi:hypothetical protein
MKAVIPPLCIVILPLLSAVVLIGCGEPANTGGGVITLRDWPDQPLTGGDSEVRNMHHLLVDEKVIDVWSTWDNDVVSAYVKILVGLRDHTRNELKNWKVKITCPTWAIGFTTFTTATIKIADGRFAQHPDYKNGVVVFQDSREFNVEKPEVHCSLNVGSHTITVEILDEQDRVKGLATLFFRVFIPPPPH